MHVSTFMNTAEQLRNNLQTSFDWKSYFVFGHFLPVTDAFPLPPPYVLHLTHNERLYRTAVRRSRLHVVLSRDA